MQKAKQLAEFSESLRNADDPFGVLQSQLARLGVNGFFYGFSQSLRDRAGQLLPSDMFAKHTYGDEWDLHVGSSAVETIDPSVQTMLDGQKVVDWSIHDYHYDLMTSEQRSVIEVEHDLGMRHGASLVLELGQGRFAGMGLWFGDAKSAEDFGRQWAVKGDTLTAMCQTFDSWMRAERPNMLIGLTPRELDCLAWLAHGMRPAEICHKLDITVKTFDKHIGSARQKLNAGTRDQAVVRAVLFGLLDV